jgi:hypothetical protein
VNSYVNLSILPDTEKPLNGNGSTHIESSNSAALCALQYLASKNTTRCFKATAEPSLRKSSSSPDARRSASPNTDAIKASDSLEIKNES